MKHCTSELTGALLDAAVSIAEGQHVLRVADALWSREHDGPVKPYAYTWALAGQIIERERISVLECGSGWFAHVATPFDPEWDDDPHDEYWEIQIPRDAVSPTPLVAAMRAYVASKLGEEVELP